MEMKSIINTVYTTPTVYLGHVEGLQGAETGDRCPRRLREVTSPQAERPEGRTLRVKTVVTQRQSCAVESQLLECRQTDEGIGGQVHQPVIGHVQYPQRRRRDAVRDPAERRDPVTAGVQRLEGRQGVE